MMIDSLRSRVDPVLYVAEAEFDPRQVIRSEYQQIESKYKNAVDTIELKNQKTRIGATSYTRSKIRQRERNEIQELLDSMAVDIKNWQEDLGNVSDLI
jgi:hypothetical protein